MLLSAARPSTVFCTVPLLRAQTVFRKTNLALRITFSAVQLKAPATSEQLVAVKDVGVWGGSK